MLSLNYYVQDEWYIVFIRKLSKSNLVRLSNEVNLLY